MKVRKRALSSGWYPIHESEVDKYLKGWGITGSELGTARAAVIPHAGWYYSGKIAAHTISHMEKNLDTIIVAGGHLPPGADIHMADEGGFQVPGGVLECDKELSTFIKQEFHVKSDIYTDNTVEIQLPLVYNHWPNCKILWLRLPPDIVVADLADRLYQRGVDSGRKIAVIGSTDLTHYGDSYGFSPAGYGKKGLEWVKNGNDHRIIEAMVNLDIDRTLQLGNEEKAACSVGGASFAVAWALKCGIEKGRCLDYYTSYDIQPADSFVGYAGILYE
ncbi:MAG: AmmeMemoRadiSam system protein B [Spirochaetales bacterium]|nr:AmmeMemoRadiSam system protein B [Spirochaetales bacterium]